MSLATDLQSLLGESTGSVFWPTAQLLDMLNAALTEMWPEVKPQLTKVTVNTSNREGWISLPVDQLMIPQSIVGVGGKYWPTTVAKLEQYHNKWKDEGAAMPAHFIMWDNETLRGWPPPDLVYALDIYGLGCAPQVMTVNDDPIVDPQLKRSVVCRAASFLLEYTMPEYATAYAQEAAELQQRVRMKYRNTLSHNIRRLRPGSKFNIAQTGQIAAGRRFN